MALQGTYLQRHPENSAFYLCLESYWPEFKETYPCFYKKEYGPLRQVVDKTEMEPTPFAEGLEIPYPQ